MGWLIGQAAVICATTGCGGGGAGDVGAGEPPVPVVQAEGAASSAGTAAAPAVSAGLAFSFTLPAARTTSAGVYDAQGRLVRTLWRGAKLPAGAHRRSWDQRDDAGRLLAGGAYSVKVVHHDVRYVWQGVVGNTSTRAGGGEPHRSYLPPSSLVAEPGRLHYAVGYNEAQSGIHGFDLAEPQVNRSTVRMIDPFSAATMIASDGSRLYWTSAGGMAGKSFVAAFDIATGAQAPFTQGRALCLNWMADGSTCYPAQSHAGVIELRDNLASPPTGLAVQRGGRLLAVAYGAQGEVRLFDKASGQRLRTLAVALKAGALNQLAFSASGDLWVLTPTGALRYASPETAVEPAARIAGLVRPLAVTVDTADDDAVWIADGGGSQQVKRFDRAGQPRGVIGTAGGAAGRVDVVSSRLCFADKPGHEQTALAVDSTRALWVVDTCHNRLLRFGNDGAATGQVAWLPASYAATVDAGNPTRVFANFLEFTLDYTRDPADPAAWRLARNWVQGLPPELRDEYSANQQWGGLRSAQTLANGRTYAQLAAHGAAWIVELRADGRVEPLRPLALGGADVSAQVLEDNGDIGWAQNVDGRQKVLRLRLTGFDTQGRPRWATQPVTLATAPAGAGTPFYRMGTFSGLRGPRYPVTASGKVVFFDPGVAADAGYHLGAVVQGGSSWDWMASPSAPLDGRGSFQTRKADPGLQYGGNVVMASGREIVYGYHGEFYTDLGNGHVGQANQFMHFRDDGLFVGQFGVPSTRAASPGTPGLSGNAFSPTLVRAGGRLYLFHNDESSHGGVHRWRIDGVDELRELRASGRTRSALVLR